ncbi:MAG TPA: amino acid permease [Thermoplasmatales archaeon]|nr:amino acid permease [Thermoplasmatales archaeon]
MGHKMELKRELGLKEVVATVVTSVIGGGLFLTTIQIQDKIPVGSSVIFSYILAAIPAIFIALCYAVLSSALPSSGGEYVFISRIIDPFIGFITTWARWFAMIAVIAAMSVGDVTIFENFLNILNMQNLSSLVSANIQFIAIFLVMIFLIVNYLGVKIYGRVQTIMFVLLIIGLSSFILFGLPYVKFSNLSSSFNPDLSLIARASSLIFFSYIGFSVINDAGDEVKNPEKILPKGVLLSISAIAIIYILIAVITYGLMSPSFYSSYDFSTGSIADVAGSFLPFGIAVFVAFTGSIAIISDINPTILSTSRLSFAWARDKIVPQKLAELNRYRVPKWTLFINTIMAIAIILLAKQFMQAIMMINMAVLIVFMATSLSALILPYKHPEIYEKAKFKFSGLWAVALAGFLLSALFFGYIIRLEEAMPGFLLLLAWVGIGSVIYVTTMESHRLHWRMYKEEKKEKELIDKEIIKKLIKGWK